MKKIRAAVVGYGNIGHFTVEALEAAPDFEIAGIVRRNANQAKPIELTNYEVVDDSTKVNDVDVAILATPTRRHATSNILLSTDTDLPRFSLSTCSPTPTTWRTSAHLSCSN